MKSIAQIIHNKTFPLRLFDNKGNRIYGEDSNGYWSKSKYADTGNRIYFESVTGFIIDLRS